MRKTPWIVRIVQTVALLFVFFGCLTVFIYTPFYSQLIVKALNYFVPVEVNEVAAQSQKMASLSDQESYEPGSDLWIARQAYLKVMEEALQNKEAADLSLIQARYKALQQLIDEAQQQEEEKQERPKVPLLVNAETELEASSASEVQAQHIFDITTHLDKEQMQKYVTFLKTHEIEIPASEPVNQEIIQDIALIKDQNENKPVVEKHAEPYAIVVLGGGLTLDKNRKDIIVNEYTRLRLQTTLDVKKQYNLPIVLSGVEAPYMQQWLKEHHVDAKLLEDRSMNTCENTRFSSLLLQKKGGAPTVILITDQYHMPRTRRLFALNGIETLPIEAPMPSKMTTWRPSEKNYDHSRRANYEMLAAMRDMWVGTECREVP